MRKEKREMRRSEEKKGLPDHLKKLVEKIDAFEIEDVTPEGYGV